jgi:hypothetical protein
MIDPQSHTIELINSQRQKPPFLLNVRFLEVKIDNQLDLFFVGEIQMERAINPCKESSESTNPTYSKMCFKRKMAKYSFSGGINPIKHPRI